MHLVRSYLRRRARRYTCLVSGSVLAASLMATSTAESEERTPHVRSVSASVLPWLGLEFSPIDASPVRVAAKPAVVIDLNVPRPMPLAPPASTSERAESGGDEEQFLSSLPSIDARRVHASASAPKPPLDEPNQSDDDAPLHAPPVEEMTGEAPSTSDAEFPSFQSPRNKTEVADEAFDEESDIDDSSGRLPEVAQDETGGTDIEEPLEEPTFQAPRNGKSLRREAEEAFDDSHLAEQVPEEMSRRRRENDRSTDHELALDEERDSRRELDRETIVAESDEGIPSRRSLAERPEPDPTILPEDSGARDNIHVAASVAEQGRGHIQRAIGLASRGAMYSSRAEFIKALRLIAHALDAEAGNTQHSEALAAGLTALDEAASFQPRGSELPADMQLSQVIAAHKTPILKNVKAPATPLAAMQAYHGYAERQLALAGGHELVAADALFGLAKLQPSLRPNDSTWSARQGPLSMTYYQAALLVYPTHYMAANELGVMFARYGQLRDAKEVLQHAASTNPDLPEVWYNLAQVHQRLGETKLAQLAQKEWETRSAKTAKPGTQTAGGVAWVDSQSFQSGSDAYDADVPPMAAMNSANAPASDGAAVEVAERLEAGESAKKRWSLWPF